MTSIRARVFLFIFLIASTIVLFSSLSFNAYNKYKYFNDQLITSYYLTELTTSLHNKRFKKEVFEELQNYRRQLQPKERQKALSKVIQAYSDKGPNSIRYHSRFFVKNEIEYRKYALAQNDFLKQRIQYFGFIGVGTSLFFLLSFIFYIQGSTLTPIKFLTKKMIDFLNQKYTYQFSVPAQNEIGHLHGTFNSLAQRVLTNMDELKSLDRAKSEFLSIASHELRTPLTSIKGSLSLLNNGITGDINEASKNLLTIAETETDRLIRLINDILDLAKIEARKFPLKKNWFNLSTLVDDAFNALNGLCETAVVNLAHKGIDNIAIYGDKDRIHQVLTNLLSNAIKYSPQNSTVFVQAEIDQNDHVRIEVKDQGKGIAPEDQELIFQQFRQATGPDNPLVKGTGLGLAIAKALVEEHDGTIGVHSVPDKGCSFYFILPEWKYATPTSQLEQVA